MAPLLQPEASNQKHAIVCEPRMGGADSLFLSIESDDCPMNIGVLAIIQDCDLDALIQRITDVMMSQAPLAAAVRRKFIKSTMELDHPIWVLNTGFDINEHIIRHQLNTTTESNDFNAALAEIVQSRFSGDKPMWEFHVFTGLKNNRTAFVLKIHHSYSDGANAVLLLQLLMDGEAPGSRKKVSSESNQTIVHAINETERYRYMNWSGLPRQLLLTLLANISLHSIILYKFMLKKRAHKSDSLAPATRFNKPISKQRSYTHGSFLLKEIKEICSAFSCSRNDVFMATVSAALRRYLQSMDELPDKSLYAGLPLSLPASDHRGVAINQLAFYRSSLATNIDDPLNRLAQVSNRLKRATDRARTQWKGRLLERMAVAPPRAMRTMSELYRRLLARKLIAPNFNVFTTLIPGPSKGWTIAGAEVVGVHPMSIPYHGAGLFVSAIRYKDQNKFGVIADRASLPDPDKFAQHMQEAFEELLTLARM